MRLVADSKAISRTVIRGIAGPNADEQLIEINAMTQVVSFLGKDAVFLAADRRLTWASGVVADDLRNKCVVYDSRFAIGFAGRAEISGRPTSEWLAGELANANSQDVGAAFHKVATRLDDFIRRISSADPTQRAIALEAVGWSNIQNKGWVPTRIRLTNILRAGLIENLSLSVQFARQSRQPAALLNVAGQPLSPSTESDLTARLRHIRKHGNDSAKICLNLVRAIRRTADENLTVGRRILTVVVPRPGASFASGARQVMMSPPNGVKVPTVQYWEDGDWNGITYGAEFAGPGIALTNVHSGPIIPMLGGMSKIEGGFRITYPIALLRRPDGSILQLNNGSNRGLIAFTNSKSLKEFRDAKARDASVLMVESPDQLDDYIVRLIDQITHVVFDIDSKTLRPSEVVTVTNRVLDRRLS